jgi:hypothetical protein
MAAVAAVDCEMAPLPTTIANATLPFNYTAAVNALAACSAVGG